MPTFFICFGLPSFRTAVSICLAVLEGSARVAVWTSLVVAATAAATVRTRPCALLGFGAATAAKASDFFPRARITDAIFGAKGTTLAKMAASTWASLGLSPALAARVTAALAKDGGGATCLPTRVQSAVLPRLMAKKSMAVGAPTGTGKTLCFLLPIAQRKEEEEGDDLRDNDGKKRAIVLVPSRDLAAQTVRVAQSLSLSQADVLVTTPGKLDVQWARQASIVALDEVDVLLSGSARDTTMGLLKAMDRRSVQLIVAGATLPQRILQRDLHWLAVYKDEALHRRVDKLHEVFVDVGDDEAERVGVLHELLLKHRGTTTMVFCNTTKSAQYVFEALQQRKHSCAAFYGGLTPPVLTSLPDVLVCTDVVSRGIDIEDVSQVVQFQFARSAVDYIHRIGRTARAGRDGTVVHFVGEAEADLVRRLRAQDKHDDVEHLFSHRRSLRKNAKKEARRLEEGKEPSL